MIAHVTINVSDFAKSREFYLKALKPLNYALVMEFAEWSVAGFGENDKADFWLHTNAKLEPVHVAFVADSKETVDTFYKEAMSAGGKDNGKPEYQKVYSPGYYASFVFDPDGNNIEAVFKDSEKE